MFCQHHLAMGAEGITLRRQLPAQIGKVMGLSVENDGQLASSVLHGLMRGREDVNDGEPSMPETDAAIRRLLFISIIRAAVPQSITTGSAQAAIGNRGSKGNPYDAAHDRFIHSHARRSGNEEPKSFSHTGALVWPDCSRWIPKRSAPVSLFSAAKYFVRASAHAVRLSTTPSSSIRLSTAHAKVKIAAAHNWLRAKPDFLCAAGENTEKIPGVTTSHSYCATAVLQCPVAGGEHLAIATPTSFA